MKKNLFIRVDSNSEIGIPSKKYFEQEVQKYCYMWKDGGEFNTLKYKS